MWVCLLAEGWFASCPARAPCLALPHRLRRSVLRHCFGAGCGVVAALIAGGCCRCRWRVLHGCSMSWAGLLAEDWVVLVAVFGVDGAGFSCVRGCGRVCWPRIGSTRWLLSVSMVCSTSMFDDVGVSGGRGMGRGEGRTCGRPAGLQTCSTVFDDVDVLGGWCLVRGAVRCWCRWCVPQACSMTWA